MMRNTKRLFALIRGRMAVAAFSFLAFLSSNAVFANEEAGPGLNPLKGWKSDLALWSGVLFLLLLVVLWKFAFGPIVKALDAREQDMLDKVNGAEKANKDAKELLSQYQQKLADSEKEVRQILEDAKADAKMVGERIVAAAKTAADEEHQKALKEIADAKDNATTELARKSAELATDLAGKILKEKINKDDHARLINGAIDEFSK